LPAELAQEILFQDPYQKLGSVVEGTSANVPKNKCGTKVETVAWFVV
jgi:hypothetical protein